VIALDAQLYALTHRGNPGDLAHYARICRDASSVLELGAGSGRVLTALARSDCALWGLELDADLLALGRRAVKQLPAGARRQVELVQGNMERFTLPRRFQRVLLPYNGFYCLLSPSAARRCLRSVRAALEPGGLFAFDVWNGDAIHTSGLQPDTPNEARLRFEHDGRSWRVFESCRPARGAQRLDVTYTYAPDGHAAPRTQLIRQRYYLVEELTQLLTSCGFQVQALRSNFSGSTFSKHSNRLVVTAVRP
jgi:SAM-dependent methyltransferase